MKKTIPVFLVVVGVGILTARSLNDINQIEGLDCRCNESKGFFLGTNYVTIPSSYVMTSDFYLIEGNENYKDYEGIIKIEFYDENLPNGLLSYNSSWPVYFMIEGLYTVYDERTLYFFYDGKRLIYEDNTPFESFGCFAMTGKEIKALAQADTVKVKVEFSYNSKVDSASGYLSEEAVAFIDLFYQALIEGNWEFMIPSPITY